MAEFNARIKNKRDTSANWTVKDPVLLNGETIIVDTASGGVRKKIGDGKKKYSQLPFDDENILTEISKKGDASFTIEATLFGHLWENARQELQIPELTAGQNGVIGLSQACTEEEILTAAAEAGLYVRDQGDGVLLIGANGTVPEKFDIPVTIVVLG